VKMSQVNSFSASGLVISNVFLNSVSCPGLSAA